MRQYFCERLNAHFGYFYTVIRSLHKRRTTFQDLEILETEEFGRVMLLDGITQVAEKNEYLYHEAMVHPALVTHHNPQDICVIGAGDGGIMREVLKHNPRRAVQCELDGEVIEVCKEYLPNVSQGAFDDARTQIEIGDGRAYIQSQTQAFDVVIMDMTDPFGPSSMLYTQEFFQEIKNSLRNPHGHDQHGSFVMHCESPIVRPIAYQQILHTLSTVYAHQQVLYVYIQMYSVLWSIVISSDSADVAKCSREEIAQRLNARGISGLHVYTPDSHHSMQVEFPFISSIRAVAHKTPLITDNAYTFQDEKNLTAADIPLQLSETHTI